MSALIALFNSTADGPADGTERAAPALLGMPESHAIHQLHAGDIAIYERIYRVFQPRLIAIAREIVPVAIAEEISQDVLSLVWDTRADWPVERGIATYLYAAARNRARDYARHQGVVGRVATTVQEDGISPGAAEPFARPDVAVEESELGQIFLRAFHALPNGARSAFALRWIHQLSYPEIAEILGVSEPAVRKQVSRAREILLQAIGWKK